jgi:hypothetical protein
MEGVIDEAGRVWKDLHLGVDQKLQDLAPQHEGGRKDKASGDDRAQFSS